MYRRDVADRIGAWLRRPTTRPGDRAPDRVAGAWSAAVRQSQPAALALALTQAAASLRALRLHYARLRTLEFARPVAGSHSVAAPFRRSRIPFASSKRPPARPSPRPASQCVAAAWSQNGGAL